MSQPYLEGDDENVDNAPEDAEGKNIPSSTGSRIVLLRKKNYLAKAKIKSKIENGIDVVTFHHKNEVYKLSNYDRLRMKLLKND